MTRGIKAFEITAIQHVPEQAGIVLARVEFNFFDASDIGEIRQVVSFSVKLFSPDTADLRSLHERILATALDQLPRIQTFCKDRSAHDLRRQVADDYHRTVERLRFPPPPPDPPAGG